MDCGNCVRHVTEAIQAVPGIHSAMVSLDSKRASVRWNPGAPADMSAVIQAVSQAGYGASIVEATSHEHGHDHAAHKLAGWQSTLWIGVLGTVPLMLGEWVFGLGTRAGSSGARSRWRQSCRSSPARSSIAAPGASSKSAAPTWTRSWRWARRPPSPTARGPCSAVTAATSISWKPPRSSRSSASDIGWSPA